MIQSLGSATLTLSRTLRLHGAKAMVFASIDRCVQQVRCHADAAMAAAPQHQAVRLI
jgi:hypothetical protein